MSVRTRIETIRLIEKMERHEAYSKRLGISDTSRFHDKEMGPAMKRSVNYEREMLGCNYSGSVCNVTG